MVLHIHEMHDIASDLSLSDYGDEDYIDMELCSSPSTIFCCSTNSSEFEFQIISLSSHDERETTPSPADELFYNGQLLPLHHPPRRLMIQTLLHPAAATTPPFTTTTTSEPFELDPDDHFFEWSNELNGFINHHPTTTRMTWTKRLKLIKNSIVGMKLKASKAYLRSLFKKPTCSDDSSGERNPTIASIMKNVDKEHQDQGVQRRSFSGAIKCSTSTTSSGASSSSSSFSLPSYNGGHDCLKRSSSATEIERSIEAAIAHCKKSQHILGHFREDYSIS